MAKPRRKAGRPSMTTIAASALLHLPQIGPDFRPVLDDMGRLVPMFSLDEARQMTAAQFVSLFDMDHDVYATWDGPNVWWNYTPRLVLAHRMKTRKDRKAIDKVRRGLKKRAAHAHFDDKVKAWLAQGEGRPTVHLCVKRPKPKAIMPYTKAKDRFKRTMAGKVVERRP